MSIPRWSHRFVPNVVPIGPAVWQLPQTVEFVTPYNPPKCPWRTVGRIVFSLCPFPQESADVYQIWCQSVQPFDSFPRLLNLWSPTPPPEISPWVLGGGRLVFSLCPFPDESTDVNQSWCQSDSFPRLLNCWPPKTRQVPPFVSRGNLFGIYSFPHEFAHVCQIWWQSAQPFGSFSRICAKVSSALSHRARCLAQKHAKKQHLYIENYNSGPNMQTTTSLPFFTASLPFFSSVRWRARGGVNDMLSACKNWIIYYIDVSNITLPLLITEDKTGCVPLDFF